MSKKTGRNSPCPCGSGNKYKFCCIYKDPKKRIVKSDQKCTSCDSHLEQDFTDDILNKVSGLSLPIKNFCKDNDLYYFEIIRLGEHIKLSEKLQKGELNKADIVNEYKKSINKDQALGLIDDACDLHECFENRKRILVDAIKAHYSGLYTLSIPVFFSQIEGLLREYGGLELKAKFKPTIPKDKWNQYFAFNMTDNAEYFNGFIDKLYRGGQSEEAFNRNPVLHGVNVDYYSEEWSLLLLLTILEIRMFIWHEQKLPQLFNSI